MSAPPNPVLRSVAFRLLGQLDEYEELMQVLAEAWPKADLLDELNARMNLMRAEAMALSQLTGAWVAFLISHSELIPAFARATSTMERLERLEQHVGLLLDVQGKCLSIATGKQRLP